MKTKVKNVSSNLSTVNYLRPGGVHFEKYRYDEMPPVPPSCVRVVCLSDTHNDHATLKLPWGHLLIHAGDVLTESGVRHTTTERGRVTLESGRVKEVDIQRASEDGIKLFEDFAAWFGAQPHPHKVLIGGNHDGVIDALGKEGVYRILQKHSKKDTIAYLLHEEARVGNLKVFGSPFARWGSQNKGFYEPPGFSYHDVPKAHIFITHYPAILPDNNDQPREDKDIVRAIDQMEARLHISGHCHWAYGLYHTSRRKVPCVVASNCSSWKNASDLFAPGAPPRLDAVDRQYGGYSATRPTVVCDVEIPEGPPSDEDPWVMPQRSVLKDSGENPHARPSKKPRAILFAPSNDKELVERLSQALGAQFEIYHFESVDEAVKSVQEASSAYTLCISKLGTKHNLGYKLFEAIRKKHGQATYIIIHSDTAMNAPETRTKMKQHYEIDCFVGYNNEEVLLEAASHVYKRATQQ
eukprot:TRINITY_DN6979_c0_g1_i1.p1 TRINITY_DN6979_c0_g1~~TRINITY_DN6979_c0_g1_i1.p1  ORF type:complete len:466 (+),score=41.37 TRINITY_DN6979_c0_g1_i1:54-1451(+)